MHVIVAPASPRTGRATIQALLRNSSSPTVVGVYRDTSKVPSDFTSHPRFRAIQGDVADADSLDFNGADAVVTISPPQYSGKNDPIVAARVNAENVRDAIAKSASVKRLVYVSSGGAELAQGTGEIMTNHVAEVALRDAAAEVVFVRCAYFMHNWDLPTLQQAEPFIASTITPADLKIPMVAAEDIGNTCASQAVSVGQALPESPFAFELRGPEPYSTNDVQQALTKAMGKEVRVELVPKEDLHKFFSGFLSPQLASLFAEMSASFLPGGVLDASKLSTDNIEHGKVSLRQAFEEMLAT